MAILFGGSRVNDKNSPATSLRVQTSLNGQPIAIVHGQQRLAGNLLWYGNFQHASGSGGGGKGVVTGGGKGQSQTTYSADIIVGLCEGPIFAVDTVWSGQSIETAGKLGLQPVLGWQAPEPWSYIATAFPQYALTYSSLAYVGGANFSLGESPNLPNLNFEVMSAISCAVTETFTVSGTNYSYNAVDFTLDSSVTEQVTIPANAPYQVQAQNPFAQTHVLVAGGGQIVGNQIPGSSSQGVIDSTGRVFSHVAGTPITGQYAIAQNSSGVMYTFAVADAGLQVTIIDLAVGSAVNYCYPTTASLTAGNPTIAISPANVPAGGGQIVLGPGIAPGTLTIYASGSTVILNQPPTASSSGAAIIVVGPALKQVLGWPAGAGEFGLSVQPGSYGSYLFNDADDGNSIIIADVPDADPASSLTDYLSNPRYGCGFPPANIGDLSALRNYAYAQSLFISPVIVAAQAGNAYLRDFSTGLNGEFVWSSGYLTFVPYGDTVVAQFGKTYAPPSAPLYFLNDDDFLAGGTATAGVSAFTSDDPVVCVRKRPSDAYNDVKVEYLDRGNSYNPTIVQAQDDSAINAYGLRSADTRQLHFFCSETPASMSAQLQLGRQQVRNIYSFTVPWYFILLDPMDIVAISDTALGLDAQWVRIIEITENQQDGTLTMTAEEYLSGTGSAPAYGNQPRLGYVPNLDAPASSVN
jgi:hypothetical protein